MKRRNTPNLRVISWFLTIVMIMPFVATVADAAVVNFLSPLPGQANGGRYVEVSVSFNTQSDLAVTKLELWIDGTKYAQKVLSKPESRGVCSFQWDTAGYANGAHFLLVKMFAGEREIASISGAGNVGASNADTIPPVVKIANIKEGSTLSGTQTIKLSSVDNSGEYPLVSLLIDQKLKLLKNTPPYTYELDTAAYEDGKHEIQAYAFDSEGNKSDVVTLEVAFNNGKIAAPAVAQAPVAQSEVKTVAKAAAPAANVESAVIPKEVVVKEEAAARAAEPVAQNVSGAKGTVAANAPAIVESAKPAAKPAETKAVVEKPVEAKAPAAAPAVPVKETPVVVAKVETPKLPDAKLSEDLRNVTSVRAPAQIRSEQPLVVATSKAAAPPIPAAAKVVKPAPAKVVKAAPAQAKAEATVSVAPKPSAPAAAAVKPAESAKATVVVKSSPTQQNIAKIKADSDALASKMMEPEQPLKVIDTVPVLNKPTTKVVKEAPVKMAAAPKVVKPAASQKMQVQPTKTTYDVIATELPEKGKMKIRDIIEAMDGVILWDSETKTVTAFVDNMKLELRIGKNIVTVNGKQMKVNLVPYISKGRTIIDVQLFHKAAQLANQKDPVAMAEPKK